MKVRRYSLAAIDRAGPEFFARQTGVPRSARRVAGYLRGVFAGGMASWDFNFDMVARGLGVSRRTVERALAWLRHKDREFKFSTRRMGRSYAVRVSGRQKSPPLSHTLSPRCCSKGANRNTPRRISGLGRNISEAGQRKLASFAGYIARRDLSGLHYDNVKVCFRFAHAFNFALAALRRGFSRNAIVLAYESALLRRHRDATDVGLNRYEPAVMRWEPSSTVSLAVQMLEDNRIDEWRVRRRLKLLVPAKALSVKLAIQCRADLAAALRGTPFAGGGMSDGIPAPTHTCPTGCEMKIAQGTNHGFV